MANTRRPTNPALSRQQSARRSTRAAVVLVALLCVGAIVALALVLGGGRETKPVASAGSTDTATPSAPATPTLPANLHCDPPPPLPSNPPSFTKPPPASLAKDATWDASIATNCGDITVRLDGAAAPQTVSSFIFLSRKGFFDDSPCPRLTATPSLGVLQCGDPTGTGGGDPGYEFGIENAPPSGRYPAGTVAMARTSDPHTNGSQFFIVYADSTLPTSGGGYSIFGQVTKGLGILRALAQAGIGGGGADGAPAQPVSILGVTVARA